MVKHASKSLLPQPHALASFPNEVPPLATSPRASPPLSTRLASRASLYPRPPAPARTPSHATLHWSACCCCLSMRARAIAATCAAWLARSIDAAMRMAAGSKLLLPALDLLFSI